MYNMSRVIRHFQAATVVMMQSWAKNYVS